MTGGPAGMTEAKLAGMTEGKLAGMTEGKFVGMAEAGPAGMTEGPGGSVIPDAPSVVADVSPFCHSRHFQSGIQDSSHAGTRE